MKDVATLQNEVAYFEQELVNFKLDHAVMRRFIGEILSPEGYGYAVTPEIRSKSAEILRNLKA